MVSGGDAGKRFEFLSRQLLARDLDERRGTPRDEERAERGLLDAAVALLLVDLDERRGLGRPAEGDRRRSAGQRAELVRAGVAAGLDVRVAALESVLLIGVQHVVAELMGDRESLAAFRLDRTVVED